MFPGARVTTARWANAIPGASPKGNVGYADIICWDCEPGTIYVWEVKSKGEAAKRSATRRQLERYRSGLAAAKESNVRPGPMLNPPQEGPNPLNQFVVVYDGKDAGVQVYRVYEQQNQALAAIEKIEMTSGSVGRRKTPITTEPSGHATMGTSTASLKTHTTSKATLNTYDATFNPAPPPVIDDPIDKPMVGHGGVIKDSRHNAVTVFVIIAVSVVVALVNAHRAAAAAAAASAAPAKPPTPNPAPVPVGGGRKFE